MTLLKDKGILICITGPMFSGKTTKLLEILGTLDEEKTIVIKPRIDNRYKIDEVCTHSGKSIPAISLETIDDGRELFKRNDIIAIDEVQFFGEEIIEIVIEQIKNKKKIILAGLEKDYLHEKFGALEDLEEISSEYYRLTGHCQECNNRSTHTFRIQRNSSQVLVGDVKEYEALCKECYENKMNYEKYI